MKTWWNYVGLIVMAIIVPFIIGLIPTFEFNGKIFGGGPIRQYIVNHIATYLPPSTANELIAQFMNGTTQDEIILYLPIAFNISAITLIIAFCFGTVLIEINNFIKNSIYKSERQKAKGAK